MAEAALRQELKRRKIGWYRAASAGLSAEDGMPMSCNAQQALTEAKIPFEKNFASKRLTEDALKEAYAVVCMTASQQTALQAYPNVTSIPALCGKEVPDPYGREIDAYRVTLRLIRECLPRVIDRCCPKIPKNPIDQ